MVLINCTLLFTNLSLRTILNLFIIEFLLKNFGTDKIKFLLFRSKIKNRVRDSFLDTAKIIRNVNKITGYREKPIFNET